MSWKCYQCDHVNNANEPECDVCGAARNLYAEEVFKLNETISKQNEELASANSKLILTKTTLENNQKSLKELEKKHFEIKNEYDLQIRLNTELKNNINNISFEKNNQISLLQNEINKFKAIKDKNNVWIVLFVITTVVSIFVGFFMHINSIKSKDDLQIHLNKLQKTNTDYQITIMKLQQAHTDLQNETNKLKAQTNPVPNPDNSIKNIDFSANIRSFIIAEENRDFNLIYSFFSPKISRYYDIDNPNYSKLKNRYEYLWNITRNSRNTILDIKKINEFTYDLETEFEYYNIKKKMVITVHSYVRFLFDNNGKIIETYEIK